MSSSTYLPSDLPEHYRTILDEAKAGEARVRDTDGTSLLLLPEADVIALRRVSTAAMNLAAVERAVEIRATGRAGAADLGDWGWLHVFDADDLREFVDEIREAIIVGAGERSSDLLDQQLAAWKITAEQADDPVFRSILSSGAAEGDFVEVSRPGRESLTVDSDGDSTGQDGAQ